MDAYIASKAISWAQLSNRTRQDRCGWCASYYKHLFWSVANELGWGSRHTRTHWSFGKLKHARTMQTTRQVAASRPGLHITPACRHQAPTRRLAVFLISKPNQTHWELQTGAAGQLGRTAGHQRQELTWSPVPSLAYHTTNKLINRQAASIDPQRWPT
jgi:hypothetical protein